MVVNVCFWHLMHTPVFLAQLLLVIAILLSDELLDTAFLAFPLNFLLTHVWPDRPLIVAHSYVTSGLLFIAVTTLVLFYASGLYAEKIGYANRYSASSRWLMHLK